MNCPFFEYIFDKAVQPAHVDGLKGTVITGIERESAKNFPASKTLPPPEAIIAVSYTHLTLPTKRIV